MPEDPPKKSALRMLNQQFPSAAAARYSVPRKFPTNMRSTMLSSCVRQEDTTTGAAMGSKAWSSLPTTLCPSLLHSEAATPTARELKVRTRTGVAGTAAPPTAAAAASTPAESRWEEGALEEALDPLSTFLWLAWRGRGVLGEAAV